MYPGLSPSELQSRWCRRKGPNLTTHSCLLHRYSTISTGARSAAPTWLSNGCQLRARCLSTLNLDIRFGAAELAMASTQPATAASGCSAGPDRSRMLPANPISDMLDGREAPGGAVKPHWLWALAAPARSNAGPDLPGSADSDVLAAEAASCSTRLMAANMSAGVRTAAPREPGHTSAGFLWDSRPAGHSMALPSVLLAVASALPWS
mmetsp:Transcript_27278/g.83873  ORF Transcript_27278/g.83873 Transcript_27278/m.83873 type:complete len:207 (+) Transcript_27278:2-622(+)